MTGVDKSIHDLSSTEIKALRLSGSEQQIPTFDEVLDTVDGKVPLLIEIKNQHNKSVVDKTVERLKSYKGEFAIQSFNPFFINRVKKLAPDFIRGVLASELKHTKSFINNFVINHMPINWICKPDFISYSHTGLPLKKRVVKNRPVLAWTITDSESAKKALQFADNIIFEKFIPEK